ncbi:MAG: hypothetical protein WAK91_06285 [Candidatus Acidiferrales bacterium]
MTALNPVPAMPAIDILETDSAANNDRRRAARASVLIPVRLRPVRFDDGNFEDVTSTTNVSRGCLNVMTWRDSYHAGMRVLVTYPLSSSAKSNGWEYLAEVVRMNQLPDGRFQVALKLQFVMQASPNPRLISL